MIPDSMDESNLRRFVRMIRLPDLQGCMVWDGYIDRDGYGKFGPFSAYRVAYEYWVGPIPKGLVVDHLCRNRKCVAPDHLEPKTRRDNIFASGSRALAAIHAAATHCPRNHPLVEGNLVPYRLARGKRDCLTCSRARTRASNAAVRATMIHFGVTQKEFTAQRLSRTDFYLAVYAREKARLLDTV